MNKRLNLHVRTNAYEKNKIQANAEAKGMNVSEYVLTLAEDKPEPNKQLNTRQLK
jgi:uncharacterized protein (DUF1778 family)